MKWFWLTNLLMFQISWFSAAFLTAYASLIIALLLLVHFALTPTPREDSKLMLLAIVGMAIDTLHLLIGTFAAEQSFFPLWLILLWVMFCISFNHSLAWFTQRSYGLLAVVGAIGGTLSYWGGIQSGALTTAQPTSFVISILLLTWALLFPSLVIGHQFLLSSAPNRIR